MAPLNQSMCAICVELQHNMTCCTHQLTANIDASLLIPNDTSAVIIVIVCLDIIDHARMYYTSTQLFSVVHYSEPERVDMHKSSRDPMNIRRYPLFYYQVTPFNCYCG